MCGIFGWIPSLPCRITALPPVAAALWDALHTRGPDDRGYAIFDRKGRCIGDETRPQVRQGACLLGQTRLSILDLSAAGHQPMFTPDARYCVTFNGEIYNYRELRDELSASGISFQTGTDTEVLLQAYAAWGRDCLTRFTGMYAFALYDTQKNTLFCARDGFGIKPFFWHRGVGGFAFASEIPALLRIPGVPKDIDMQEAYNFLTFGIVERGPKTLLQGIQRLQPAHWLEVNIPLMEPNPPRQDALHIRRYWQIPLPTASPISFEDAAVGVRERFLESVRLHLRSDVPVGVALSGGIDSTAVACAVRHLEPDAELHTFSYVADDPTLSEEIWIDRAAAGCRAISHKVKPSAENLLHDMDDMLLRQGEPFATTSIYAQYTVMRLARENGVAVVLEGQGADELFAGYDGYLEERMTTLLRQNKVNEAIDFLMAAGQWPGREKKTLTLLARCGLCPPPEEEPQPFIAQRILRLQAAHKAGIIGPCHPFSSSAYAGDDILRRRLAEELTYASVPGLMRHGDRNAMSFSIENRVPFCTPEMAEFALSLPEEYLISDAACTKYVLRAALRGLVPDVILDRRDKVGFEAPGLLWLRQLLPWVLQHFLSSQSFFIHSQNLLQTWKEIMRGAQRFDWFYWRVLCYLRWKDLLNLKEPV